MPSLITTANLCAPDDFYEALIDAHKDLSSADSHALNARLILVLANHIGHIETLREALQAARGDPTASSLESEEDTAHER